jgi:hypothetical protein
MNRLVAYQPYYPYFGGALIMLVAYALVYLYQPFSEFGNIFILDILIVLAAFSAAISVLRVFLTYDPQDVSRQIWLFFAVGVLLWAFAEVIWMLYDLLAEENPLLSPADALWVVGYAFFGLALQRQFRVIYRIPLKRELLLASIFVFSVFVAVFAVTYALTGGWDLYDLIGYFYFVADMAIGISALYLLYIFRVALLGRIWFSLFAFAIADLVYVTTTADGGAYWNATSYTRLFVDGIYILAYLLLMLLAYAQYRLMRYGLDGAQE